MQSVSIDITFITIHSQKDRLNRCGVCTHTETLAFSTYRLQVQGLSADRSSVWGGTSRSVGKLIAQNLDPHYFIYLTELHF